MAGKLGRDEFEGYEWLWNREGVEGVGVGVLLLEGF